MSAPPGHDDDLADLLAMVTVARENSMTPSGREALRALGENCDRLGVIACAIKLLAQLADDAGFCPGHFREYAARAIARLSRSRRRAGPTRPQDGSGACVRDLPAAALRRIIQRRPSTAFDPEASDSLTETPAAPP